jgi:predicted ATPase
VVNTAARLQQITPPGTIAMGETTRRLVANAVRLEPLDAASLKGKRKPVTAWRLVEVLPGAPPFARRLDAPMVGRAAELAQLEAAFERVCSDRSPYLFTVLGAAGIGKTRLAGELLASLAGRATALVGRCLPYGRDITYWPLREVIGSAVEHDGREAIAELLQGEDDADVVSARVATAIGLGTGEAVAAEETAWALRRLFETLARRRPLLIVFEDVHWAESAFLDLVEYLADWLRDAPVYIVCLARPELFEARPNWLGGKLNAGSLLLEPLPADAVELLIDELPAGAALTPATRSKVKSTAEGNPLFVEQLLASWSEDPRPRAELEVPETVQALLAARLDRLGPAERHVVERAAVIGRDFWLAGVEALLPEDGRDTAARHLHSLTRKDLVRPERSELSGLEGFRFRHILIQQAAYRATPKRRRAELHERFADWFTEYLGERAPEHQEILGYHLEQAFRYSSELGPIDERVRAIGVAAADRLAAAGHRADARCDTRAAAALFDRACALLEGDDPRRLRLLPDLGNALRMYGDLARAENTLNEAVAGAEASGDRALYARAAVERALVQLEHEPTSAPREVVGRVAREAIPILESSSDYRALAKAWNLRSFEFGLELGYETSMEMRERALDYARRARDARVEAEMLLWIGLALWEGPMPVDDALARADELFAAASGPLAAAVGLVTFACLKALRGDFDEARELRPRATAILQDLGLDLWIAGWANAWGPIELLAGEPEAAEELLRSGYEELERLGEKSYRSTMAGSLAEALYQQGRYEEAARFAIVCAELAGKDDLGSQIPWRMTKAKLLAREANGGAAEELGREAVALAQKTDALRMQGDTFTAFAEVLDLTGRRREAEEYARKALERYQRKGIIPAIARTRAFLDRAEPARSRR